MGLMKALAGSDVRAPSRPSRRGPKPGEVYIEFTGMKELEKAMELWLPKFQNKVLRFAARKAANVVKAEVVQRAPVGDEDDPHYDGTANPDAAPGTMKKSIKVRALPRSKLTTGAQVTIGEGLYTGAAYYGAFQEFGWIHTGRGKTRGTGKHIPGKSFLRGSLYDKDQEVYQVYIKEGRKKIDQITAEAMRESGGTKILQRPTK